MKPPLLTLGLIISMINILFSQAPLKIRGACSFDEAPLKNEYYVDNPDEFSIESVNAITRRIGLDRKFLVKRASVKNAMAAIGEDGKKYILINPAFMVTVKNQGSDWAAYFILAHELGHILNEHPLDKPELRTPEMELAADKFAAATLCGMGASLDQTKIAVSLFVGEDQHTYYPEKDDRMFAIVTGWQDANCSDNLTYEARLIEGKWNYYASGRQLGYNNDRKYYKVCLSISAPRSELARITKVRYYYLHDSFGEGGSEGKIFRDQQNGDDNFQNCLTIWGTFPLKAVIYYKEGKTMTIDLDW